MSDEQSIRDEIVQTIARAEDGTRTGSRPHRHRIIADAILASPVIRRIQAEAIRDAADDWHEKHAGTRPAPYLFMVDRADRIEQNSEGNVT